MKKDLNISSTRPSKSSTDVIVHARFNSLTNRQKEVCSLMVEGKLSKQIATKLGMSINTVKKHRMAVLEKMRADSLVSLARMVDPLLADISESPSAVTESTATNRPLRCLVIEDDCSLRAAMVEALTHFHYDVMSLPDGEAIGSIMETANIDVVLLDILLGDDKKDGLKISQFLRENYPCGIIMTTAIGAESKQLEALLESADAYLVKPINFEMLHAVIQSVARRL